MILLGVIICVLKEGGDFSSSLSGAERSTDLEVVVDIASLGTGVVGHVGTGAVGTLGLDVDIGKVID